MRRLAPLLVVALFALAGCKIFTVLGPEDPGFSYFDVADVERLPDGGFLAVGCGFDSSYGGQGIVLVRPDVPIVTFTQCQGPALDASVAANGDVYFSKNSADCCVSPPPVPFHRIDRLDPDTGVVTTVFTFDRLISTVTLAPDGRLLFGSQDATPDGAGVYHFRIHEVTGPAASIPVPNTGDLGLNDFAVDADGTIYASGSGPFTGPARNRVYAVTASGVRRVVAGTVVSGFSGDGGPATAARLSGPSGVDVNGAGTVFVADSGNGRVRSIGTGGIIRTVAGGGTTTGDGGLATAAQLTPGVVAVDEGDHFWVSDFGQQNVRYVGVAAP